LRFFKAIFLIFLFSQTKAQVNAPSFRCVSTATNGDITLTWIVPPDPGGKFFSYEIYKSNTLAGPFGAPIAVITTYSTTSYTDVCACGNSGGRYYYIRTKSGPTGTITSQSSDTLRSIYLNLGGISTATLVYNNLHSPRLPSTATSFTVMREFPPPAWSGIGTTSTTIFTDVITRCNVFYNYQIKIADASGCVSQSNVNGGNFKDGTPPDSPINTLMDSVSVNCGGQTTIGWHPSSNGDCAGYYIYMNNGTNWNIIDTVNGKNNTLYTTSTTSANSASTGFAIASFDSCGNLGVIATPGHNTIFLKTQYNVCSRTVNLTWNSYTSMPLGVMLYKVYRSTNAGPYVLISSINGNSYEDLNLSPGKTYCYRVRAVNTTGTITSSSNCSCLIATAPPASSYVYLKSASVDTDQSVLVSLYCDTVVPCKGFNVLRSEDGINYSYHGFVPYSGFSNLYYRDASALSAAMSYFYKAEVLDSCGNVRYTSNIGKTILLQVKNDEQIFFNNILQWSDYTNWSGGVSGYYIYRIVNEVMDPLPVTFVPFGITSYTDNVEEIVSASGKVGYVVQAIEGFGNIHNLIASAYSNKTDAYIEATIFVPNAFAPKGENRIWKPISQFVEKTDYKVTVFNRLGQKVFETTDENEGWNGSDMDDNTYVYLITYKNSRGEFREQKGTVTLIR
jgi:gliding motility-associated-like protein